MLKVIDLEKRYKNNIVFQGVSIDFSNPNLYILQGINGSGKSTLIKVLSNIIYKSSGRIYRDINISYLPDKFSMPKLMKAKKYLKIILNMYGKNDLYDELITKYQIPNKRIGELSKGNLCKVGLIQILYMDSDCYILDEPLDGLDDYAKRLLKEEIINLINNKKIVILSLHNKNLFNDLKPEIYEIKEGFIKLKERKKKKDEKEIQDINAY